MTNLVEFDSPAGKSTGYLVAPPGGPHPGVLIIQEWWGLDSGIKEMTNRLGAAGFVAFAPDLYRGELAGHDEMDRAEALMRKLPPDRAAADMSAAVDFLASHPSVSRGGIGVVGFCMGGLLSFLVAAMRPDQVKALVPFYGFPHGPTEPDWSRLAAKVRGHMAERDDFFPPDRARALEAKLQALGKDVILTVHPGTGHAFMGPHNALGTLDEQLGKRIWPEVVSFIRNTLSEVGAVTSPAARADGLVVPRT